MLNFRCPVCGQNLFLQNKSLVCKNGHCFDLSAKGYVNLLQSQSSKNKRHGDDSAMLHSRQDFLNCGFYEPLRNAVAEKIPQNSTILDVGCGEGYYTDFICRSRNATIYGIDISKDALILAHKRNPDFNLAVASIAALPIQNESMDVVLNIFAPENTDEFHRVLKTDGTFIKVIPLEKHLTELRAAIYDKPYDNKVELLTPLGFSAVDFIQLKYKMDVSGENLHNLFKMTPYYYKTGIADQQKIANLESLNISAEFGICIYKKTGQ